MPPSIKRLPPEVASKIAAGEVAERPFNVVKELMENSADASATKISVEISGGGLSLVRVADNGRGIPPDDLPLALERFATSKASTVEEVYNASTFGFRGEALAAVSSVSDFTLKSGVSSGEAFSVRSVFGRVGEIRPAPYFKGTLAEAVNLFENVPARRKFLKSSKSLEMEIVRLVKHFSLINPGIEVYLISDGRELYHALAAEDIAVRSSKVFPGKGFYKGEVSYNDSKVTAAATLPAQSDRLKRDAIVVGVNGRLIKDASLVQAVIRAYYRSIPDGKYPLAAIDIRIPPSQVDPNVHPAKMEVRFENPKDIFALVADAVAVALDGRGVSIHSVYSNITASQSIKFDNLPTVTEEDFKFKINKDKPVSLVKSAAVLSDIRNEIDADVQGFAEAKPFTPSQSPDNMDIPLDKVFHSSSKSASPEYTMKLDDISLFAGSAEPGDSGEKGFEKKIASGSFRIIGQIDDSYIICETLDKRILFIDQHAAHERILFEKNRAKNSGKPAGIVLHEPVLTELSDELFESVLENKEALEGFGYAFALGEEPFTVEITRIPYAAARSDVASLFKRIAGDLFLTGRSKTEDAPKAMLSCKSAIKAGDSLSAEEMDYLVRLLFNTDNFGTCPHGRPIIYAMSVSELARKFLR